MKHRDKGKNFDDTLPKPKAAKDIEALIAKGDTAKLNEALADSDAIQRELAAKYQDLPSTLQFDRAKAVIMESESLPFKDLSVFQKRFYADALATVGRYEEAAKVSPDKEQKAEYKAVIKAIEKDDSETCQCEDRKLVTLEGNTAVTENIPRHFIKKQVFSQKHKREVNIEVCNICHQVNAK